MTFLITKIIAYLISALAIGFGMGWFVQYSQAKRLREQLNSVIFETKSRIPQLETTITNRDQKIEQLNLKLAEHSGEKVSSAPETDKKPTKASPKQAGVDKANREKVAAAEAKLKASESELKQLRVEVADLNTQLEIANSMAEKATASTSNSGNGAGDNTGREYLSGIEDIFDNGGGDTVDVSAERANPSAGNRQESNAQVQVSQTSSLDSAELDNLRTECESLNEARRKLSETLDTQTRELEQANEQRNLQEKSLTVLNQQLELARLANERILRELQQFKNAVNSDEPDNQSATA